MDDSTVASCPTGKRLLSGSCTGRPPPDLGQARPKVAWPHRAITEVVDKHAMIGR